MALTIRTTPDQDTMIANLKRVLGCKTATQALLYAGERYVHLYKQCEDSYQEIRQLQNQLDRVHDLMKSRLNADQQIASLTSQKSLY